MRFMKAALRLAAALLMTAAVAHAQSTSGTISGRVVDAQQLPVPGVTINAESPNLQGIRTAVTSENGDYILSLLPSGVYKLTFDLSGFLVDQFAHRQSSALAPGHGHPVNRRKLRQFFLRQQADDFQKIAEFFFGQDFIDPLDLDELQGLFPTS